MQEDKVQNYSIRLGPTHRHMLAALARETERKPPDVIRYLIRREFEVLDIKQKEVSNDERP